MMELVTSGILMFNLVQLSSTNMNAELEELISIQEAARILNVNVQTLRRWDRNGTLKAERVGTRKGVGDRRYRKSDIEAYLSQNKK